MTIKQVFSLGAAAAILCTALASPVGASFDAQGRGRGQSKAKPAKAAKTKAAEPANPQVVVIFKEADRPKFQTYFTTHKFVAEPLPPGIAMNIARGKPLPPGISKRVLPADLLIYVPRDPNTTYYIVGDRIVAVRNGTIIDVLLNILR